MPPKKKNANKKKVKVAGVGGRRSLAGTTVAVRSRPQTERISLTETVSHKPVWTVTSKKGGNEMRVHVKDLLDIEQGPVSAADAGRPFIWNYPFTVGVASSGVGSFASIPKLRNFAGNYARYKVLWVKLHYAPMCPATTAGNISQAVLPGYSDGFSSQQEYAACQQAYIGPVWQKNATPVWNNREKRWFWTRDTSSDQLNDVIPFTLSTMLSGVSDIAQIGMVWIEMEIDFVDFVAPPQGSASFKMTASADLTANLSDQVAFQQCQRMDGVWGWAGRLIRKWFSSAGSGTLKPGSTVGVDKGIKELFFDFLFGLGTEFEVVGKQKAKQIHPNLRAPDDASRIASGEVVVWCGDTNDRVEPDAMPRILAGRSKSSKAEVGAPAVIASGHVLVEVWFQPLDGVGGAGIIYAADFAPGLAAGAEVNGQWSGMVSQPGYMWIQLTPGDTRTVNSTSSIAFDTVVSTTSS